MTWNILFGGEDRFDRIVAFIERANADVVVLQECVGWAHDGDTPDRLARIASAVRVPPDARHAQLALARPRGSGRRFHVAVYSRLPIVKSKAHADPAHVGHVIAEVTIAAPGGDVVLLATHFDSHGEDERVRDATTLCAIAPRDRVQRERVLIAGDLNALSRRDPYPHDLDDKLRAAGTTKYGVPARFETMPMLENNGFVDLLYTNNDRPHWITAVRDRGGVRIDYRTDYLLASPSLARHVRDVRVLPCDGASDHEAVIATFAATP